ncbi:hypothetical protein Emed_007521 [Eimeria media]
MGEKEEGEEGPATAAMRLAHARQRLRQMAASTQSLLERCNGASAKPKEVQVEEIRARLAAADRDFLETQKQQQEQDTQHAKRQLEHLQAQHKRQKQKAVEEEERLQRRVHELEAAVVVAKANATDAYTTAQKRLVQLSCDLEEATAGRETLQQRVSGLEAALQQQREQQQQQQQQQQEAAHALQEELAAVQQMLQRERQEHKQQAADDFRLEREGLELRLQTANARLEAVSRIKQAGLQERKCVEQLQAANDRLRQEKEELQQQLVAAAKQQEQLQEQQQLQQQQKEQQQQLLDCTRDLKETEMQRQDLLAEVMQWRKLAASFVVDETPTREAFRRWLLLLVNSVQALQFTRREAEAELQQLQRQQQQLQKELAQQKDSVASLKLQLAEAEMKQQQQQHRQQHALSAEKAANELLKAKLAGALHATSEDIERLLQPAAAAKGDSCSSCQELRKQLETSQDETRGVQQLLQQQQEILRRQETELQRMRKAEERLASLVFEGEEVGKIAAAVVNTLLLSCTPDSLPLLGCCLFVDVIILLLLLLLSRSVLLSCHCCCNRGAVAAAVFYNSHTDKTADGYAPPLGAAARIAAAAAAAAISAVLLENARLKGELQRKATEAAELEKRQGQLLNELADVSVCLGRERTLQAQLQRALERVSALEGLLRGGSGDAAQHADKVQTLEAEGLVSPQPEHQLQQQQQQQQQQQAALREAVYHILGWDVTFRKGEALLGKIRCLAICNSFRLLRKASEVTWYTVLHICCCCMHAAAAAAAAAIVLCVFPVCCYKGETDTEELVILQCLYATHDGVLVFTPQKPQQEQQQQQQQEQQQQQQEKQQQMKGDNDASSAADGAAAEVCVGEPQESSSAATATAAAENVEPDRCSLNLKETQTALPSDQQPKQQQQQQQDSGLMRFAKSRYSVSFLNYYANLLQKDPQLVSCCYCCCCVSLLLLLLLLSLSFAAVPVVLMHDYPLFQSFYVLRPQLLLFSLLLLLLLLLQSGRALSQPWPGFAAFLCLEELRRPPETCMACCCRCHELQQRHIAAAAPAPAAASAATAPAAARTSMTSLASTSQSSSNWLLLLVSYEALQESNSGSLIVCGG